MKEASGEQDLMNNTEPAPISVEKTSVHRDELVEARSTPGPALGSRLNTPVDTELEAVEDILGGDVDDDIDGMEAAAAEEAALIPVANTKLKNGHSARNEETIRMLFGRLHGPVENLRYGDRASLRDHLVLLHAPLVEHCARNFAASGEPVEDLVQEGYVGLIKAVDRFDPKKGVRFSTYACHLINGEIRHYLRDLGRLIHEPGWHFELRQRIARVNDQLTQQLSRPPEPEEIATSLNIEPGTVREVLKNQNVLAVEYLDSDNDSDDDGRGGEWLNKAATGTAAAGATAESRVDDQMMLDIALPQLRELEKKAVTLHFFEDCSKTEVARRLNISVNYAAYLIKRATERLRAIIETSEEVSVGSLSQQRTRAAYLLELVKSTARQPEDAATEAGAATGRTNRRRVAKVSTTVPAPPRRGAASLTEFVGWIDEEVRRAARYAQEFSVLWLQIRNWQEITDKLEGEQPQHALAAAQHLAYRSCRDTDKVAMVSIPEIGGLHFLVLMPHTGVLGERTGERWMENTSAAGIPAGEQELLNGVQSRFAFALFPRDGKTADDLFRVLGSQLRD